MYEKLIEMFQKYPIGTPIRLKSDYPNEVRTVADYESKGSVWYLRLSDGKSVCVDRLSELEVV